MKITLDKYYELQENPSSKKEYEEVLKQLSDETISKELFRVKDEICPKRGELHSNIIKSYLNRYEPSEGAAPSLCLITGSIGSGKTSVKDAIVEGVTVKGTEMKPVESYIFINLDDIKNQLEEYKILKEINPKQAAAFVQAESGRIAGKLFKRSIQKKLNIMYEKNLVRGKNNKPQVVEDLRMARKKGYLIDLCVVFVDSYETVQKRVDERAERIKRYVPNERVRYTFDNLFPNLEEIAKTKYVDTISFFDNSDDLIKSLGCFFSDECLELFARVAASDSKKFDEKVTRALYGKLKDKRVRNPMMDFYNHLHGRKIRNTSDV